MALNIELFYIISRKLSLCGLFWTTLERAAAKQRYAEREKHRQTGKQKQSQRCDR